MGSSIYWNKSKKSVVSNYLGSNVVDDPIATLSHLTESVLKSRTMRLLLLCY